jgi:hypothetical protein
MSRIIHTLLAVIALSWCSAASAHDVFGIPDTLVGRYSPNLDQCDASKIELSVYRPYFYDRRPQPLGYVVSYRVTATGFILSLVNQRCEKRIEEVTVIDDNKIRVNGTDGPKTLFRCPPIPPAGPPPTVTYSAIPRC